MDWYLAATLDEISLLEPGEVAWFEGATVTRSSELPAPKPKRPAPTLRRQPTAGDVEIHHEPVVIRRYYPTTFSIR